MTLQDDFDRLHETGQQFWKAIVRSLRLEEIVVWLVEPARVVSEWLERRRGSFLLLACIVLLLVALALTR